MRTTICRSRLWLVIAGALVAPALLSAQRADTASTRTHVIRPGDTLWKLAQQYLGDGYRWREILALNARQLRGPTQLTVGQTLRIPVRGGSPPPRSEKSETRAAPPPAPTSRPAQAPFTTSGRTIFYGRRNTGFIPPATEPDSSGSTLPEAAVVRAFEAAAAPFVVDSETLAAAGSCAEPGDLSPRARPGVTLSESLRVRLPTGARADSAARFVLARRGPALDVGQVMIPTAVIRPMSAQAAAPAEAEIVAQFDVVSCSDAVLPLEIPAVPEGARPSRVTSGATGEVLWVDSEALLPTLQHYLVIDIGRGAGLRPGDQIAVGEREDETAAAVATIVRVSDRAASALVISQSRGAIAPGARVRVSARLP